MYPVRVFNFLYEPEILLHFTEVHNMNIILSFKCEPLMTANQQGNPLILCFLLLQLPDSIFLLRGETQKYTHQLGVSKIVIPKPLPGNLIQQIWGGAQEPGYLSSSTGDPGVGRPDPQDHALEILAYRKGIYLLQKSYGLSAKLYKEKGANIEEIYQGHGNPSSGRETSFGLLQNARLFSTYPHQRFIFKPFLILLYSSKQ